MYREFPKDDPYTDEQFYTELDELIDLSETLRELERELARGLTNPEEAGRLLHDALEALKLRAHERLVKRHREERECCA